MEAAILEKVNLWLNGDYDADTKEKITRLQNENPDELAESFYQNLEFGTGGLRGIMGVGTNRINKYTIGMATQGFANYLSKTYGDTEVKVAVAHDCRNNSRFFAETTAKVFAANGFKVFMFEDLRPTPELSFTVRHLGCHAGVVITASHNPKEYNGYKAYWNDGGQLVAPHDTNVIKEVDAIKGVGSVQWEGNAENISILGSGMDDAYMDMAKGLSIYPDVISRHKDLKIVYTPIHGSGIKLAPQLLAMYGFTNVTVVEEQAVPDGNFPTVVYPNPEESEAMSIGLKKATEIDADILLGTDPDSDRVGIGVKDNNGNWILVNGNQTAALVFNYVIEARKVKGILRPNDMVVKTIVTTELVDNIAKAYGVNCYNVLTGFKWIAELIKEKEGKENYIVGGEESYGLMVGDQVRDKDAISAVALICEMAAYEKDKGRSLYQKLVDLYVQYGFYKEGLISITKKGMRGQEEIAEMMKGYRENPPVSINGSPVVQLLDYDQKIGKNLATKESWPIDLPKSNVLQFVLEDGTKISARPSGTEPKIKFYFSVKTKLDNAEDYDKVNAELDAKISKIIEDLKLK